MTSDAIFISADREFYEKLSLEEKRGYYKCGKNFVTLDDIDTWPVTREGLGKLIPMDDSL